jgi:ADP-ribose pyrophosphatase YjhB (NUDIX family)
MLLVLNKAVVHFVARYRPSQILVLPTRRPRKTDPRLERRIEMAWSHRLQKAPGGELWDSVLARLVAHGALPDRLALFLGKTSYREFVGTNLESEDLHEVLGDDYYANPLGVSAAVLTKDGALLLARRSQRVAEARGQWDLPGGNVPYLEAAGGDPLGTLFAEMREELEIEPAAVEEEPVCVGLVENGQTHRPDLIFELRIRERARGLLKRLRARPGLEHDDFLCVPTSREDLLSLLRERGEELTPVAAGGLATFVA